jgi:predicted ester cyclase
MRYDGRTLASMGMRAFWTDRFHWYGPGGIGMARGHADYERAHQGPFLRAFPDRVGGDHKCRIGDGPYVASTGWPSIRATHGGGGWLGMPPTGRPVSMRVMDFWRRSDDRLAENWVFIDILDLALQMDVDILARAAALGT